VVDGLKNCFWNAFKSAVKNWFNSKVEEVLGLPIMIFKLLFKGCIKMKDIGKMAWEGLKAAIPMVLVQLLIEKLVAMIVPAAGAILTIIEGLRAAWGTVSRIITAFALFFAFLKAVKTGSAAGPFAMALAAAGVVVIDFVANWLLMRLRKPAGAIAGKLKALAQKIVAGLKRVVGAVKRGAKVAAGAIRRGVAAVGRAVRRGAQAVGRGLRRVGQAIARSKVGKAIAATARAIARSPVGRAIARAVGATRRLFARGKAAVQRGKDKLKAWWDKRKRDREKRKAERRARARSETIAALQRLIARGTSHTLMKLQLLRLKYQYGWRVLRMRANAQAGTLAIEGGFSPTEPLVQGAIVLEEVHTGVSVKTADQSGAAYEAATAGYVEKDLAAELFGAGRYEVTRTPFKPLADPAAAARPLSAAEKARGRVSALDLVRLNQQMEIRKGGVTKRRPEYRAEVFGTDPSGRRTEKPVEVHAIEVTTVTDFKDKSEVGGKHKLDQFWHTIDSLQDRYPTSNIVYTIVAPGEPTPDTRRYINETVNKMGVAHRVRVVWRIVGRL
jgi:hypothetical protein